MKNKIRKIAIVADNYPSEGRPVYVFVQQLVEQFVDMGVEVVVIAPQSITNSLVRGNKLRNKFSEVYTPNGNKYHVYRPYTITTANKIKVVDKIFNRFRKKSIARIIKEVQPDVIYGHFWHSAYNAFDVAKECGIPLFVATGESVIKLNPNNYEDKLMPFTEYVKGVICVSTKNKNESISLGLTSAEKCVVIPNAINPQVFYKKDKLDARSQLNISHDDFVVAFVGSFIERKGANRVAEAIKQLNNPAIKSIFIGKPMGDDNRYIPECDGILYRGPLEHSKIVDYLNCADVFVLPTLHEGCCNAIVEAMACGLPIISSDREFNYDILNSHNSILVNPLSIEEISNAIEQLFRDSRLKDNLAQEAYATAKQHTIYSRAQKILSYIYCNV